MNRQQAMEQARQASVQAWAQAQRQALQEAVKNTPVNQISPAAAAGASGTGSGGVGLMPTPNTNTIPPDVAGYVPFEQSILIVLDSGEPATHLKYVTYNYSTDTLSNLVDSDIVNTDWYLDRSAPSNDGYVLLLWVNNNNGDVRIQYVAPDATIVNGTIISASSWNSLLSWDMGGHVEALGSQSSPIWYYTVNSSNSLTLHYYYEGAQYTLTAANANANSNRFENSYNPVSRSGQSIFRVRINDGTYKYYSIGPSGTGLLVTRAVGDNMQIETPYQFYTKDLKLDGYYGYYTDFQVYQYMTYNETYSRYLINDGFATIKSGTTFDWDMAATINTRIGELETGGILNDCYVDYMITEGSHLFMVLKNANTSGRYLFVLNVDTKTITSSTYWNYGDNYWVHDMLNGTVVLRGYNSESYDNDFNYYDELNLVTMWNDGTVNVDTYTDGIRIQSGDLDKTGTVMTWFSKPAAGGQISIVKKVKTAGTSGTSGSSGTSGTNGSSGTSGTSGSGGTAPVFTPIPGFIEATDDNNNYFYYQWLWNAEQEKPFYVLHLESNDTIIKKLGMEVDGTFNSSNIRAFRYNDYSEYEDNYGVHIAIGNNGDIDWWTMDLSTYKWNLQTTYKNDSWSTRRMDYALGYRNQKRILLDYSTGTAHSIKPSGLSSQKFGAVYSNNPGFTYSDAMDNGLEDGTWYIVDTENMTLKQVYQGQDTCDGYSRSDRYWYFRCVDNGYIDIVNGSITRTIDAYSPLYTIHNDIWFANWD